MHRLRLSIPSARMERYDDACAQTPVDPVLLYRWAQRVSLAVFDDIGTLEVSLRSAMARELVATFGDRWFADIDLLDDESAKMVARAWGSAGLKDLSAPADVLHSKLVATLMFGFWVKILGRGAYFGQGPMRQRRIYDTLLWKPALSKAFPGAGPGSRQRVERLARRVQVLRNRIAHHEHIVWGVPQPGAGSRLALGAAHRDILDLAGLMDADLEGWLIDNSTVPVLLSEAPVDVARLML